MRRKKKGKLVTVVHMCIGILFLTLFPVHRSDSDLAGWRLWLQVWISSGSVADSIKTALFPMPVKIFALVV